jgi:mono/diheme cytochrome c family protein
MVNRFAKITATAVTALLFGALLLSGFTTTPARAEDEVKPSDTAAYYKAKCQMCHGPKAEKKFDTALTEEQMVEAIMKGKKAEKPPHMPAYESKGMTADNAKAFIEYMKQLKG